MLNNTNIGRLILESISQSQTAKTASKKFDTSEAKKISEGLKKVASYPYKESVYDSVKEIMKIAADLIDHANETISNIESHNCDLEKAAEVRVVIDDMLNYGLIDEGSFQEKLSELLEKDKTELEIVKNAIDMIKCSKSENIFFDKNAQYKTASGKRGIFDGVLN